MSQELRILSRADLLPLLPELGALLHATVLDGASVGFVAPFSQADAEGFWQSAVFPAVAKGDTIMWGAFLDERLVGTVQLVLAGMPNQTHKAEIAKMMVHPQARRKGIAASLMTAAIARAEQEARRLLVLDTRSGDPSQSLYARFGFKVAGEIPGYALAPDGSDRVDPTTYMYLVLS